MPVWIFAKNWALPLVSRIELHQDKPGNVTQLTSLTNKRSENHIRRTTMISELSFARRVNQIIVENDIDPQQAARCLEKICSALIASSSVEDQQALQEAMDTGMQAGLEASK